MQTIAAVASAWVLATGLLAPVDCAAQPQEPPAAPPLTLTLGTPVNPSGSMPIGERVIEEACRRLGIGVVFKPAPQYREIEEANDGVTDGDSHRFADVVLAYPNLILVPTPVSKVSIVIYGRSPDLVTKTRAEISRMKIGFPRGFLILRKYSQGMDVTEGRTYPTTFDMLSNGRVDVLMVSLLDTAEVVARLSPKPVMWPHLWVSEPLHLVLHRRHADLVPRIDAVLQQMAREGLIDKFYDEAVRAMKVPPVPPDDQPAVAANPRR